MRTVVTLMLGFALLMGGCGTSDTSEGTDAGDTSAMEDAGTDMATSPDGDEQTQGQFEIGTNPVSQANAEGFKPMNEGVEVPITWGVQGSWMVVLAFRSQEMFEGLFDVRANITIDGVDKGEIWLESQETFPGGDGWDYYFNMFLALDIDGDPPPRGTPAHITMSVTDENGTTAEQAYDVEIGEQIGGP